MVEPVYATELFHGPREDYTQLKRFSQGKSLGQFDRRAPDHRVRSGVPVHALMQIGGTRFVALSTPALDLHMG
jgi:hypothetical protein